MDLSYVLIRWVLLLRILPSYCSDWRKHHLCSCFFNQSSQCHEIILIALGLLNLNDQNLAIIRELNQSRVAPSTRKNISQKLISLPTWHISDGYIKEKPLLTFTQTAVVMNKQHSVTMNGGNSSEKNFRVKIQFYYLTTLILVCECKCFALIFLIFANQQLLCITRCFI